MIPTDSDLQHSEPPPAGDSPDRGRLETLSLFPATETGSALGDGLLKLSQEREPADDVEREVEHEADAPTTNRRRFPRHASGCRVQFHRCGVNAPLRWSEKDWLLHATSDEGVLSDVSMAGIAFSFDEAVEVDESLMLRIRSPKLGTQVDTVGRVVRSAEDDDGTWMIFCRLDRKLTLDQIQPLRLQFSSDAFV